MLHNLSSPPFQTFLVPANTLVITIAPDGRVNQTLTNGNKSRIFELTGPQAAASGAMDLLNKSAENTQEAYECYFEMNTEEPSG